MSTRIRSRVAVAVLLAATSWNCAAGAPAATSAWSATTDWNVRLRHEHVDDDGFDEDADATTLRLRAGLAVRMPRGFSARIEGEGIAAAGAYDDGTGPPSSRPPVIDPAGVEWNQAWLGWHSDELGVTLGRQRLLFDNQRWIGNSGWRQNEQTFDAAALEWKPHPEVVARYAWLDRVHRVSGDDARIATARERALDTHLLHLAWLGAQQQLAGYVYLHDDRDVAIASTATTGLRWTGARLHEGEGFSWTAELARQREYAGNPQSFSHAYWLLEPAMAWRGLTARAGWEHLGGDGTHALQAPLGTLHAFNGWADRFLVTPPDGLDDRWLGLSGRIGRGLPASAPVWNVAWHDYRGDDSSDYGHEWNASLVVPVRPGLSAMLKFADYRAQGFSVDSRRVWLQLEWIP